MQDSKLLGGLIRLHILYHAAREPVFGLGIIEELAHHGYKLSPGTIYPLLQELERKGYLRSSPRLDRGRIRRLYRATSYGRQALQQGKQRVHELFGELFEDEIAIRGAKHSPRRATNVRRFRRGARTRS